ncbi:hypothetical protein EYD10_04637 [Varanus komodoensis]|nr:hypothetical protein EYD10_04637 [Varanus komodoensis]
MTCALLDDLGLCINHEKSSLIPTQVIDFIGARLDSIREIAFLPPERRDILCSHIQRIRLHGTVPAISIQRLLGHMAAAVAIVPYARLRMRPLQLFFNASFHPQRDSSNKLIRIPFAILRTLTWWTMSTNLSTGVPFRLPQPTTTLYTNASLIGWGATCSGLRVQGTWTRQEARKHINVLELQAIFNALKALKTVLCRQVVQIASDNIPAVFYINKQGGTKSPVLARLSMDIWDWCIPRGIMLIAIHLAGTDNIEADMLSRHMLTTHEWELARQTCAKLFRLWGYPEIDLFAAQNNRVCARYCSRMGIGSGSMGDALMVPWTNMTFYAFPPIPLLTRVVARIAQHCATGILITPWWLRQPWFATLLRLSEGTFLHLPNISQLLTQQDGAVRHPDMTSLKLTAWRYRLAETVPTTSYSAEEPVQRTVQPRLTSGSTTIASVPTATDQEIQTILESALRPSTRRSYADEWLFPDKESSQLDSSNITLMTCETSYSFLTSGLNDDQAHENKQAVEDHHEDIFTYSSKPRSAPHGKPLNLSLEGCSFPVDLRENISGRGAQMEDDFYGNESNEDESYSELTQEAQNLHTSCFIAGSSEPVISKEIPRKMTCRSPENWANRGFAKQASEESLAPRPEDLTGMMEMTDNIQGNLLSTSCLCPTGSVTQSCKETSGTSTSISRKSLKEIPWENSNKIISIPVSVLEDEESIALFSYNLFEKRGHCRFCTPYNHFASLEGNISYLG